MSPEFQLIFDGAIGLLIFFALRALKTQDESIKAAHKLTSDLMVKLQSIEVLVAGNYITRPEFAKSIEAMFSKLDLISDKLDTKQDKAACIPIHSLQK